MTDVSETVAAVRRTLGDLAPSLRAGIVGRRQRRDEENPSGERQLAADRWADRYLCNTLGCIDGVGAFASEEREAVEECGDGLSVTVDPLDGSGNLASNNAVGTIVGVYDAPLPARGRDLVAAGYLQFGPTTTLVFATDDGCREHRVGDGHVGSGTPLEIGAEPTVHGFGGTPPTWTDGFRRYADAVTDDHKVRYCGAFVSDVSQVLQYGGVFAYPELVDRPNGKLRLQFECNPMAYVVEAAGGRSSDGERSVLDRPDDDLHGRSPVHLGNPELIERLERELAAS